MLTEVECVRVVSGGHAEDVVVLAALKVLLKPVQHDKIETFA